MIKLNYALVLLILPISLWAQKPKQLNASEIELALNKLNVLTSVLYVAAHPDDENTRLIAWLSNEALANTAYLSMTRGDGGQNLIGPEIREYLGIIRTQELLGARDIDGGRQFFTRANDFGYSKSPEETQEIWNREEVLKDVVQVYRKFKPDVVITRFPSDGGGGHGHHTTSAILAREAFNLSGDENVYPEQVKKYGTWQPKRLYLNTGRWWNTSITADSPGVITVDVGKYNPLIGESYSETAARSRTMHKSQGFGSSGARGESIEFLEYREGEQASDNLFENIETGWNRVKGGKKVSELIEKALEKYNPSKPYEITADLIEIRRAIGLVKNKYWRELKLEDVDKLIKNSLGLYLEAVNNDFFATNGDQLNIHIEAVNRSPVQVFIKRAIVNNTYSDTTLNLTLNNNVELSFQMSATVPENKEWTQPYWLKKEGTLGMYNVLDNDKIGQPENLPAFTTTLTLNILGEDIMYDVPIAYKWNDPVDGESHRPFVVTPPVFINIEGSIHVFSTQEEKIIEVTVKSGKGNLHGDLRLQIPSGWKVTPEKHEFSFETKGSESHYEFTLEPPKNQAQGYISAVAAINGKEINRGLVEISYDHFPTQVVFPETQSKVVKLDIQKYGKEIGYIQGAGDDVPESLRNLGYNVSELADNDLNYDHLKQYDAVVLGIRALNTRESLTNAMNDLLKYAREGGALVIQYNTSHRLITNNFAPYPLELSRDRVSVEEAPVRILDKDHPVMNVPNKITEADFEGWVQERGLYFPNQWSSEYSAILSSNDPGETPKNGGLLVAQTGKGYFVYTGYSWFRELPAGVPGAYRIFANILSLGAENESENPK